MQRIASGSAANQDLTTEKTVATIQPPPCGVAHYRLVIRFTDLSTDSLIVMRETVGADDFEIGRDTIDAAKSKIEQDFCLAYNQSALPIKIIDVGTGTAPATTADWTWELFRLDMTDQSQPDQLLPIQSTNPIMFRMSGSSSVTPVVTISKAGTAFATPSGGSTVTNILGHVWKFTPTATDTAVAGELLVKATATTSGQPSYYEIQVASVLIFEDASEITAAAVDDALQDDFDAINVESGFNRAGAGATEYTIKYVEEEDNTDELAGVRVWVSTDAEGTNVVAGDLPTNDDGEVTFLLDAGVTYYRWAKKPGREQEQGVAFTVPNP